MPGTNSGYLLNALQSPILFRGDATTAYRDPAAIYSDGWFYLYFTLTKIEGPGQVFQYAAWSKSSDLLHWTEPKIFTPRDNRLNYGSPGDVIRFAGEWVLCLQTYPRPMVSNTVTTTHASGLCAARILNIGARQNCCGSKDRMCQSRNGPDDRSFSI